MLTINVLSTIIFVLATEEPSFLQTISRCDYYLCTSPVSLPLCSSSLSHATPRSRDPYCRVFYLRDTAHWQHCTQCVHISSQDEGCVFIICIHLYTSNLVSKCIDKCYWSCLEHLSDKTVFLSDIEVFYVRLICVDRTLNVFPFAGW